MKKVLKFLSVFLIFVSLIALPASAISEINSENYSYLFDENEHTIDAPNPYELNAIITGEDFDISSFGRLEDVEVSYDGSIFFSDSGNKAIYKISADGNKTVCQEFIIDGEITTFEKPMGLFATESGELYVADRGSRYIYIFDFDFNYLRKVNPPDSKEFFSQNAYEPLRVCVDSGGRIYVISANQTQGILQFTKEGKFMGFLGAIRVSPTIKDLIIRTFGTKEHKESTFRLIPTEYNSLDIDGDSFIFGTISALEASDLKNEVTSKSGQSAPIMRINPKGEDVLLRKGRYSPIGDINFLIYEPGKKRNGDELNGPSRFVDVTCGENGVYTVLDKERGRVYTYNNNGELLFMFGGASDKSNNFKLPVSITYSGHDLIVADAEANNIKVFVPTEYAEKIYKAIDLHERGLYDEETGIWEEIKREYTGSELAYLGIGRAELFNKNYLEAMRNFEKADNKEYYSKAFKGYRKQLGSENIGWIILAIVISVTGIVVMMFLLRKKKRNEYDIASPSTLWGRVFYAKNVILHPFKTFYELKNGGIGTISSASIILGSTVALTFLQKATEPYLFSTAGEQNIFVQGFLAIVLIVVLFTVANWCFTSLMDGKGRMKDIYIYTCYSLTPLLISTPIITILNQFCSLDELALLSFISTVSSILVVFLIFVGTLVVHDYSLGKTIIMLILTVVGMMILVFIALLCVTLVQQIIIFVSNIINELQLR